jgi:hypothetical protein
MMKTAPPYNLVLWAVPRFRRSQFFPLGGIVTQAPCIDNLQDGIKENSQPEENNPVVAPGVEIHAYH